MFPDQVKVNKSQHKPPFFLSKNERIKKSFQNAILLSSFLKNIRDKGVSKNYGKYMKEFLVGTFSFPAPT